ncbi:hypothetical protein EJ04DRAFT_77756 [Polyplosphaeria fusca]|uniref:Uncharacterized protein n=1 Tax=Polyplosphaeria fusca TaxID=682080 RepID=A0A9P4QP10_9PLEO|nr:hypothetical protein EJ04DRAFT_77756 [Polyplosphaeria fusca]
MDLGRGVSACLGWSEVVVACRDPGMGHARMRSTGSALCSAFGYVYWCLTEPRRWKIRRVCLFDWTRGEVSGTWKRSQGRGRAEVYKTLSIS